MRSTLALVAIIVVTAAVYLPGLDGGLIFDDRPNLEPVTQWLNGEISASQVVFGNASGPLGRPVAMASFVFNIVIGGDSIMALKVGNLLLHLLTGVFLYFLLRALIARDRHLAQHNSWIPLALTAVWLLHPMMVGTVLYVVQRMAILSTLFVIAALLAFVHARVRIEAGKSLTGSALLFIGVPMLTILAALSKENGLLAPLLCGVIEWVYFVPKKAHRRPLPARLFAQIFIALPMAAALVLVVLQPGFLLDGYANRQFGLLERVLTQSRVLFDYAGNLILPSGPKLSPLRDDYQVSSTLFSPMTTFFSTVGWLILTGMAVGLRKQVQGFTAGLGIYLIGHSMESTVFPLLLYFEHRNYLPSLGIFLASASLLAMLGNFARQKMENPRIVLQVGIAGLLVTLTAATFARASVWSSSESLVRQALVNYPNSVHLLTELQRIHMTKSNPDVASARQLSFKLMNRDLPTTRLIGMLNLMRIDCLVDGKTNTDLVARAFETKPETLEPDLFTIIDALATVVREEPCANLSPKRMGDGISSMLEQSSFPSNNHLVWRLRFLAGQLYWIERDVANSYSQLQLAWINSDKNPTVGLMLLGLQINLDMQERAFELYGDLESSISWSDVKGRRLLEQYRNDLANKFLDDSRYNSTALPETLRDEQ